MLLLSNTLESHAAVQPEMLVTKLQSFGQVADAVVYEPPVVWGTKPASCAPSLQPRARVLASRRGLRRRCS